jgi:hypothetical protein
MRTRSSFSGIKGSGREADHLPPFSAEIKNSGAISPLPIRLHSVGLDQALAFTFYLNKTRGGKEILGITDDANFMQSE